MAQSEALVLLHFSPTEMAWAQDAPPQVVNPVSVAPEPHPSPMGYNLMGDIHSHGHYPARHSADDVKSARTTGDLHYIW
ncbi:MAG: hypothetical protein UZ21_OP11001000791 [Microgenomates bacterium OLB22]|nr:MAG: hypothetical protein UZ21_OP11001000791 [Microgenomates bacterium OLB22]